MSPAKGLRSIFLRASPKHGHRRETSRETAPSTSQHHSFSATMMEENIQNAEEIITKWDPEASSYARITSIFYESREEARQFLRAVAELQRAMHYFMGNSTVSGAKSLVRGQTLMKAAMRRLQKEFYQILSANRDRLDPESVTASDRSSLSLNSCSSISDLEDDEITTAKESIDEVERVSMLAMADLSSIAECMISCGYGKECVDVYKTIRRSIVDEGLYKLGFDRLSPAQIQKLNWDVLELRIRNWLAVSKVAVRTLFAGERALCDHVFASSSSIRESSFAEIARDPAIYFLGFPELVALKPKMTPEKVFRLLDLYNSMPELLPEIESTFSHDSTAAVCTQARSSLARLAEAVRALLFDFETAIKKEASKAPVPGGGLHPLTRYTMNYLVFLADYGDALLEIYADQPLQMPSSLPEPLFDAIMGTSAPPSPAYRGGESFISSVSPRFAWLILVLLCKLDSKAEAYPEVPLAYLFLANNLQYVVNKVRKSQLMDILGDEWVSKNESKVRGYARNYERLAWGNVLAAAAPSPGLPSDAASAREALCQFNEAFADACKEQASWIVPHGKMRDELKLSVARKLIPAYRSLHQYAENMLRGERDLSSVLRFTPDDLGNYLSDLFFGDTTSGSSTISTSDSSKRSRLAVSSVSSLKG
ncbi:exocyst complex component EXO70H1-like [Wolffia australiana]